jgi:malonate transporter and related proteins
MLHILEVTFPFFALVLVGWAVARRGWLPLESIPALNLFVLYFALPCMLFRFAAATPIARVFDPSTFGTWLFCALVAVAVSMVALRRGATGWNDAAFGTLVAVFSNSGFMGVPLLVDLLGPRAAAPAIVTLVVDMVVTTSLCIALSRLGQAGTHGAGHAVANALKGMATNPLPWAIGAGCVVSATGWVLPALLMKPVSMMADAASPAALFTLGVVLARAQRLSAQAPASAAGRSDVPLVVAFKLLAHPLLVWAAGRAAMALGAPLDPFDANVLVLVAALPSASNVPMLAERFGADAGRVARIVLVSTALAFVSFTAAVGLLGGG